MKKTIPQLLIHGGAGSRFPNVEQAEIRGRSLKKILDEIYPKMRKGLSAVEAVTLAVSMLEDDPLYNAGFGSKVQSDGQIRMSASLMDGDKRVFSGCVNVTKIRNPIFLARILQENEDRVLGSDGALQMAKNLGLPLRSPFTAERKIELAQYLKSLGREKKTNADWRKRAAAGQFDSNASVVSVKSASAKKFGGKMGTVGAVACDSQGRLAAATSTGGRGFEFPHRVSDSATVAGNYANAQCALSATGIGEQINEFGLAVRLATHCELGKDLEVSAKKLLALAKKEKLEFGFIALNRHKMVALTATDHLIWASARGKEMLLNP